MIELIEKLERNFEAEQSLNDRYKNVLTGVFYTRFASDEDQLSELLWVSKIQKRVLGMRHRLLENIQSETTKQMYALSSKQRELNTKQYQNVA